MAVEATRAPEPQGPGVVTRLVTYYNGVMAEMRKVTWPDWPQVIRFTRAIIIFVLVLSLLIAILDQILSFILVRIIPGLFGVGGT